MPGHPADEDMLRRVEVKTRCGHIEVHHIRARSNHEAILAIWTGREDISEMFAIPLPN